VFNHAPPGYECFVCQTVAGTDNDGDWVKQSEIVHRDDAATAWMNSRFWGRNPGHVVVVSNEHHENIYDAPVSVAVGVQEAARQIALRLMAAYGCDGTSTRQHNGPAGNQDAFHYHVHVFPRYRGDRLYDQERRMSTPAERAPYVAKLMAAEVADHHHRHAPPGYDCPFCNVVAGGSDDWTQQADIVARTDGATAWIAPAWWPNNAGHAIVVPNEHIENIYGLVPQHSRPVLDLARRVAIGLMETYGCEGTSTRQHNGPGADQEVWHYHLHVFPRFVGDGLYGAERRRTTASEREPYAQRLRAWLAS
jgi:histidine triad (HIT) family protein